MGLSGIDESKLKRAFLEEAEELLEHLSESLVELEQDNKNVDIVNEVFRVMHSLKSESALMGFKRLSELAHAMEDVFEKARSGSLNLEKSVMDTVLTGIDIIHEIVTEISKGGEDSQFEINDMVIDLKKIAGEKVASITQVEDLSETKRREIEFEGSSIFTDFEKSQLEEAQDRNEKFYRMVYRIEKESEMKYTRAYLVFNKLESVVNVIKTLPPFDSEEYDDAAYVEITVYFTTAGDEKEAHEAADVDQIKKVEFFRLDYEQFVVKKEAAPVVRPKATSTREVREKIEKSSIRVDTQKLDNFWRLIGDFVICKSFFSGAFDKIKESDDFNKQKGDFEFVSDSLERIAQGMQQTMMETRMVPISVIFRKFPRFIRDLSRILNKNVEIELFGEETEIDRSVIDELSDPLTHLIRNALDHGIEFPEERVRVGKPETGRIIVSAHQSGGNIIIEIEDDGRGLDFERIREKALSLGMMDNTDLEEKDIINFIFHPGFTTKEVVTDLSGRGVGMDVVATKIKNNLKGDVNVRSTKGQGAHFTITLPLKLNIMNALIVKSSDYLYAIPINSMKETVKVQGSDITRSGEQDFYMYRDKQIPICHLETLLGRDARKSNEYYGIIVYHVDKMACLIVDEFIEEQDIVIKPIDEIINYHKIFSGTSIMGDGMIVYIIDTSFTDNFS